MSEPSLALQNAVYDRLIASPDVTSHVAPSRIIDGRARPDQFPCIILGAGQTVLEPITLARQHVRVYLEAHIWTLEGGLEIAKMIAGSVTRALQDAPALAGYGLVDFAVTGSRFMRDPSAEHGHAIVSLEALIEVRQ